MSEDWKIAAKQNFAEKRQPSNLVEIKVPEWSTSVYYWPNMSLAEKRAVALAYTEGSDTNAAHVAQLLARARDEHGRLLFTERERDDLFNRYAPEIIERVSMAMMDQRPNVEDASKNS